MNKRKAKKYALRACAQSLMMDVDGGWETHTWIGVEYDSAEAKRFNEAIADVISELWRRGEETPADVADAEFMSRLEETGILRRR